MKSSTPVRSIPARVLLIVGVSAIIVGFAVYQGRALVGRSYNGYSLRTGRAVIPPVDGARFRRSYQVKFNGLKTQFGHYVASISAEAVINEYARRAKSEDLTVAPRAAVPGLGSHAAGCSALSYVTREETVIGIVAFDDPETGGSNYFVGAMPAVEAKKESSGDCPGREAPGVPRPPRSKRTLCIEDLGGVKSVMTFYEAWGQPSGIVEDLREAMAEKDWKERAESSATLTGNYEGVALLSFSRGHEQCIVGVDQDPKTGKIVILVFWAERPWLPKGVAL